MPGDDLAIERLENALVRLEKELAQRLRSGVLQEDQSYAEIVAERDALRSAVEIAEVRINQTIESILALLEDGDGNG